mmetsp:Transcript_31410/g.86357  ORF Transcript_31410/g.86357 Transcript_31410/m.86357 type:complete len:298 (+) Transcript_31410:67-960(+)|eukprot:CAMPEP_0117468838 /NCGR_PEP_ID=MMETSP0784-20121206/6386_1 /TAXON_ID=39447 /ORGANISM="" /LENGTH=297 /DNA_ID=CAMNT_0005262867 /DNA_START=60 /DNA_END=953 /DNA_ORIENTATION=-
MPSSHEEVQTLHRAVTHLELAKEVAERQDAMVANALSSVMGMPQLIAQLEDDSKARQGAAAGVGGGASEASNPARLEPHAACGVALTLNKPVLSLPPILPPASHWEQPPARQFPVARPGMRRRVKLPEVASPSFVVDGEPRPCGHQDAAGFAFMQSLGATSGCGARRTESAIFTASLRRSVLVVCIESLQTQKHMRHDCSAPTLAQLERCLHAKGCPVDEVHAILSICSSDPEQFGVQTVGELGPPEESSPSSLPMLARARAPPPHDFLGAQLRGTLEAYLASKRGRFLARRREDVA